MDTVITVSDQADDAAAKVLGEGLGAFNDAKLGFGDRLPLQVLVRDRASGAVLGGVIGRTSLGVLTIQTVYLPEALRGRDIGTRMMGLAEAEARLPRRRGGDHFLPGAGLLPAPRLAHFWRDPGFARRRAPHLPHQGLHLTSAAAIAAAPVAKTIEEGPGEFLLPAFLQLCANIASNSSATMLVILIIGFTAGPAVSL